MRFERRRIAHERKTEAGRRENPSREAYWTEKVRKARRAILNERERRYRYMHAHINSVFVFELQ